jgi:S-adenosylmethionine synthetase
MRERLVVEALAATPVAARRVELVERKGIGHPDTICDALVEAISHALSRMYLERSGVILHYNIERRSWWPASAARDSVEVRSAARSSSS